MESSRSNADNLTFNEAPTDASSTERREFAHGDFASVEEFAEFLFNQEDANRCSHGEFCFCQSIWSSTSLNLLENTNASNGERTTNAFINPDTQTIMPVKENEGELGEAERDMQELIEQSRVFDDQDLIELAQNITNAYAQFIARDPYLNINLHHKYEATTSTYPDRKEHCSICLVEYDDGDEIAKIDCGHLYHVGCIKKWNKIKNNCPVCRRRVLVSQFE